MEIKKASTLRAHRSNLCCRSGINVKMYAEEWACGRLFAFILGCRSYGALITTTDGYFYQHVAPTELGDILCVLCAAFAISAVTFENRKERGEFRKGRKENRRGRKMPF